MPEPPEAFLRYLIKPVDSLFSDLRQGTRVLQVGFRNGFWPRRLADLGCTVVSIDPSEAEMAGARRTWLQARFQPLQVCDDFSGQLGEEPFDFVLSLEYVEHLYSPGQWAEACFRALKPGGRLVCSTPYYGYLKNLLLGVLNKWDEHFSALNEGGHVKFFSRKTLTQLLSGVGFQAIRFRGAGRLPYLWKSMVVSADRSE